MMNTLISFLISLSLFLPTDLTYARIKSGAALCDFIGGEYVETAVLPPTFYVAVLKENDDGYCLVSYMDVTGFVKAEALEKVDFTPKTKYADCGFTVSNDSQPANLRSTPSRGDNVVAVMPNGAVGKVIGTAVGDELISGAGGIWYYVRYENGGTLTYGYVYNAHITAEPFGTGSDEREPQKDGGIQDEREQSAFELSPPLQIVLIVALCLPVVLCAFMLRKKKSPKKDSPKTDSQA